MINKRKPSSGKSMQYSTALPRRALLFRAIEVLLSLFYKKSHIDKEEHFKRWEREKIVNLGLASHPVPTKYSSAKEIALKSWDREKVSNFGLSTPRVAKNVHRTEHLPQEKPIERDLTPKIAPVQSWKKTPKPNVIEKTLPANANNLGDSIDDFFKVLGYE